MLVKSGLLAAGLVYVLGLVGYFALRASHASPAIAAKQAEGPMGLPELTDIDGLARSRDGRIFATVSQYTVSLWDATSGQNLLVLQNGDNESIFAPAFSRDGSLLATVSTAQRYKIEGHLLLWNPATGERLGSIDNLSYPGCASFNPAGTLIAVGGNTLYLVDPSTKEIVNQRAGSSSLSGRATFSQSSLDSGTTLYSVQSSIFKCFNRRKERSLVTRMASAANA